MNMSQKLIAYFSASGSTANLAKTLAAAADAELYEIRPAIPYERRDLNWMDKKSRSTLEMQDKSCRPALADVDAPLADADVIFLGFPIWWYREPIIVDSFLDAYDFSGKTIGPFFTSGVSDLGEGQERIEALAKNAKVLSGRRFSARASERELTGWIAGLQLAERRNENEKTGCSISSACSGACLCRLRQRPGTGRPGTRAGAGSRPCTREDR